MDFYDLCSSAWYPYNNVVARLSYFDVWLSPEMMITACVVSILDGMISMAAYWGLCGRRDMELISVLSRIILSSIIAHYRHLKINYSDIDSQSC